MGGGDRQKKMLVVRGREIKGGGESRPKQAKSSRQSGQEAGTRWREDVT